MAFGNRRHSARRERSRWLRAIAGTILVASVTMASSAEPPEAPAQPPGRKAAAKPATPVQPVAARGPARNTPHRRQATGPALQLRGAGGPYPSAGPAVPRLQDSQARRPATPRFSPVQPGRVRLHYGRVRRGERPAADARRLDGTPAQAGGNPDLSGCRLHRLGQSAHGRSGARTGVPDGAAAGPAAQPDSRDRGAIGPGALADPPWKPSTSSCRGSPRTPHGCRSIWRLLQPRSSSPRPVPGWPASPSTMKTFRARRQVR